MEVIVLALQVIRWSLVAAVVAVVIMLVRVVMGPIQNFILPQYLIPTQHLFVVLVAVAVVMLHHQFLMQLMLVLREMLAVVLVVVHLIMSLRRLEVL